MGALELTDLAQLRAAHPDADWDALEQLRATAYGHARAALHAVAWLIPVRVREPVSAGWTASDPPPGAPERLMNAEFCLWDARELIRRDGPHDDTRLFLALDAVRELDARIREIRYAAEEGDAG